MVTALFKQSDAQKNCSTKETPLHFQYYESMSLYLSTA